jgi:protein-S-isoprenylcysteine O-methyltransferase Ste14
MKNKKMLIYAVVLTIATIGQIILAFLLYTPENNVTLRYFGWGVLLLSAFFGWMPIFSFRRRGSVKGRGYIHTTVLVNKGIYGVVRHPQYLAGILISVALPMITQKWPVAVIGLFDTVLYYLNTFEEEKGCVGKFGEEYKHYMNRVPRLNFVLGIVRRIRRTRETF